MLIVLLKKQIIIQKLLKLKRNLLIIHDKYITTPEFNNLAASVFNARLAQANLVSKTDFHQVPVFIVQLQQIKQINESIENEIKKLKTLDLSYFIRESHFEKDGTQNYLVFQPLNNILN